MAGKKYIMGVDGGGSKTLAVIVDEAGNVLGAGLSGGANHQIDGVETAIENISLAAHQALGAAGLTAEQIDYTMYGLAGADREIDFRILRPALAQLPFGKWDVVCDTIEGLRTGANKGVGVVLVCGSGTNAAGRNKKGAMVQTGGFGYTYGDENGGSYLALQTFRAAIRSWEFREIPSILPDKVGRALGYDNLESAWNAMLDANTEEVPGKLSITLHEAADEGDELAIGLLEHAGYELGIAANSVIRRLGGFGDDVIPIVLVGSVVQKGRSRYLLNKLKETVAEQNNYFELIIPEMEPVFGAVMLGMDELGIDVDSTMLDNFTKSEVVSHF